TFKAFYDALKPGGILGVTDHRAKPGTPLQEMIRSGYVTEDYVIQLARRAGFRLAAKSEINANPKDTKNYPRGVWILPPTLRLGDQDREKYLAIGESDRMTLKFVKPR
ncbi:MAG TPA: methyltransferase, partial [Burkholderiales bacterium]|nr:methyltransferase [Burkholderiales bacterium]